MERPGHEVMLEPKDEAAWAFSRQAAWKEVFRDVSENSQSPGPSWVLLGTAILGLVTALFIAVERYYGLQAAKAEAERAQEQRRKLAERRTPDPGPPPTPAPGPSSDQPATGTSDPKPPPATPDPKPLPVMAAGMPPFREDFARVDEGASPRAGRGTTRSSSAGATTAPGWRCRATVSTQYVPKVRIEGDFYLECEFTLAWEHPKLELTLEGKKAHRT